MINTSDLMNIGPVMGIYIWFILGTDDEIYVWSGKISLIDSFVWGHNSPF